jgi:hypothetical protein
MGLGDSLLVAMLVPIGVEKTPHQDLLVLLTQVLAERGVEPINSVELARGRLVEQVCEVWVGLVLVPPPTGCMTSLATRCSLDSMTALRGEPARWLSA